MSKIGDSGNPIDKGYKSHTGKKSKKHYDDEVIDVPDRSEDYESVCYSLRDEDVEDQLAAITSKNNIKIDTDDELEYDNDNNIDDDISCCSDDSELSTTLEHPEGFAIDVKKHSNTTKDRSIKIKHDTENVTYITRKSVAHPNGYLKLVMGCMFSGKTTYIIRESKKWQSINKSVLMINYAMDKRYSDQDKVISHDKFSSDCMMVDKLTDKLNRVVNNYDVILINEGQFFTGLRHYVKHWCDELKKIVVVSGLDGNYLRSKFGEISDLIPDCDDVIKLKAYCSMCKDGTEAIFTWKTKDNPAISKKVIVDIGTDKYEPLCRKHYNEEKELALSRNMIS